MTRWANQWSCVQAQIEKADGMQFPHPIAAILALVELMEASTGRPWSTCAIVSTLTILSIHSDRTCDRAHARPTDAGRYSTEFGRPGRLSTLGAFLCALWQWRSAFLDVYRGTSVNKLQDFPVYKRLLITQGRSFCSVTAPQCREKIAELAVGFLRDDCTVRVVSSGHQVEG
jgi:translation initiation factor eIF-2B subunit alpha